MRSTLSVSDLVLGVTILVSTIICSVMCLENESGPQDMSHEPLYPSLSERYFRNYYDMGEPVWKRAPAGGFVGMRGKKAPSSTFFGMRGKKGPSGFLGMRGKKQDPSSSSLLLSGDLGGAVAVPWTTLKMKGAPSMERVEGFDDYSLFGVTGPSGLLKRAPAEGFMGLRGKRSSSSVVRGQPASSYK